MACASRNGSTIAATAASAESAAGQIRLVIRDRGDHPAGNVFGASPCGNRGADPAMGRSASPVSVWWPGIDQPDLRAAQFAGGGAVVGGERGLEAE